MAQLLFKAERNPFAKHFRWNVKCYSIDEHGKQHLTRNPAPSDETDHFTTQEAAELQAQHWNKRYGEQQEQE